MDRGGETHRKMVRSDDVRKRNRSRILAAIRRASPISRTEIAEETGLSAATVSAIVSDLMAEDIIGPVANGAPSANSRGRPKVALAVNPDTALVAAVTLDFNVLAAHVFDYAGRMRAEHVVAFEARRARRSGLRSRLIDSASAALAKAGGPRRALRRITAGMQGTVDIDGRTLLWSPITPVRQQPISNWLRDAFDVPVHVANDCDMIAHALHWRTPDLFGDNFAAILLSHGVGMGLFQNGRLVNGTQSSGMEFGHMSFVPGGALCRCGSRGCVEAYAGDYAMYRAANGNRSDPPPQGPFDAGAITAILERAEGGDATARSAIEAAGKALGTGLASVFALLDPVPVALVGKGVAAFSMMESSIRRALEDAAQYGGRRHIPIHCFPDEKELLQQGCAISALKALDEEIANGTPRLATA